MNRLEIIVFLNHTKLMPTVINNTAELDDFIKEINGLRPLLDEKKEAKGE